MIEQIVKLCLQNLLDYSDERREMILELECSAKLQRSRDCQGETRRCSFYIKNLLDVSSDRIQELKTLLMNALQYSFQWISDQQYANLAQDILQLFDKHNIDFEMSDINNFVQYPKICSLLILIAARHRRYIDCSFLLTKLNEIDHIDLRLVINSMLYMDLKEEQIVRQMMQICLENDYFKEIQILLLNPNPHKQIFELAFKIFSQSNHQCWMQSVVYMQTNYQCDRERIKKQITQFDKLNQGLIQLINSIIDQQLGNQLVKILDKLEVNEYYFDLLTILLLNDIQEGIDYREQLKKIPDDYFDKENDYTQDSLFLFVETLLALNIVDQKELVIQK
ncbi:unnamed protein product (macronuclear) [Paramecium tetraurelia]|uniref:Uncharacterized protein n=1 Tax=Paramecium tetraurelia TaxID=5888 RepID=A0C4H6_PARTE|nr:uncharacterized protein GSPATT00035173001 [Paramecium tetraurelia]CAK65693.1 unnamed protein product [Paramecium tetraurelia]|eukprot:XP_001433090.1 hypothetical protein (macronuclear) [Paramecium tetraurelia strain d4-2]